MSAPGLRLNTAADHAVARAAQDKRNYGRKWGRAFRGERTTTRAVFVLGKRFSLVPVLSYYGLLDWYIVEGGLDAARVLDFVQRCVARDPPPPAGARALTGSRSGATPAAVPIAALRGGHGQLRDTPQH